MTPKQIGASPGQAEHLEFINILRGVAIFAVVLCHANGFASRYSGVVELPFGLNVLFVAGAQGVALFFALSAYTLMRSMDARSAVERFPTVKFLIRRLFRIAPAYYAVLLVIYALVGHEAAGYFAPDSGGITWEDLRRHLLFVNGFFPYQINDILGVEWSISAEMAFYVVLPFLYSTLFMLNSKTLVAAAILVAYVVSALIYGDMFFRLGHFKPLDATSPDLPIYSTWKYFFIASQLHVFMLGIGCWFVLKHFQFKAMQHRTSTWALVWGLVGIFIIAAFTFRAFADNGLVTFYSRFFWAWFFAAAIIAMAAIKPGRNALFSRLGKVSFSLYLVHYPILDSLNEVFGSTRFSAHPLFNYAVFELIALPICYALACALYFLIERPGMAVGRRLIAAIDRPSTALSKR